MNDINIKNEKSKVAIVYCDNYDTEKVYEKVKVALDLIGGIKDIIPLEDKVLIKPNLLNKAKPDQAVTTHPVVFGAVCRILKEEGYCATYGDSPGPPKNPEMVSESCGLKTVAKKYDIPFANFTSGRKIKYEDGVEGKYFEICDGVLEADSIINVCKMKTHQLMRITGAVKNMYGCICGLNKGIGHTKYPDPFMFGKMLVDLNKLLKPKLHIMDGILAMEGNGPMSGNPVNMNVILISKDPVALDFVFCKLIDLDPNIVPTIKYGDEYGLGNGKDEKIEILYENTEKNPLTKVSEGGLIYDGFNVEKNPIKVENIKSVFKLTRFALRKPVIKKDKCIKCGDCVEACPVRPKALDFKKGRGEVPVYNYKSCIRCYCCQEMCPKHAIDVKTPLIGKLTMYK